MPGLGDALLGNLQDALEDSEFGKRLETATEATLDLKAEVEAAKEELAGARDDLQEAIDLLHDLVEQG